jgi:DHA1 family tetracycline resistance protein-like MFS transporter
MTQAPAAKRTILFIFIAVLVDIIGLGIIVPVVPGLIMELTGEGVSRAAIYGGWLYFTYALMQFFCAPILGNISDRVGRRPVILFSLFSLGINYLIMGFAPTLTWLFLGRALAGVAGASFIPAYAYIADVSPPERRAQNFGILGAAFGLGFVIGPAVGGMLGEIGIRVPFFAAAGLSLANVTFGYFVLPESLPKELRRAFNIRRANPLGALLDIRKYPLVPPLAAAVFFWQLGHQVLPSTWAFFTMFRFHWTEAAVGASLAFVGLVTAISQGLLTRVVIPGIGERRTAVVGLVCAFSAYVFYAFASRGWMMYAGMSAWLMAGLVFPSMQAIMSQQVPANAQGELQGAVASLYSLAAVIGPPVMTQLFGRFSAETSSIHFPGAAFLCAACMMVVSGVLLVRALRRAAATERARKPAAAAGAMESVVPMESKPV